MGAFLATVEVCASSPALGSSVGFSSRLGWAGAAAAEALKAGMHLQASVLPA